MALLGLLLLLLPGLLVTVQLSPRKRDGVAFCTLVVLTALAWHMVAFWWLRLLPVGLVWLVWCSAAAAAAGLVLDRRRLRITLRRVKRPSPLILLAFLLLFSARLYPAVVASVSPGADMSMHGYMARLISEADGVPTSYRPLLPIDSFGGFSAGLPSLGAILAAVEGIDLMWAMLILACVVHVSTTAALYLLCRNRLGEWPAFVGAVAMTVMSRAPQDYFAWGGNPTVLSLALILVAWASLEPSADVAARAPRWRSAIPVAMCFSGALLAHAVLPFAMVFVFGGLMLAWLWPRHWAERWAWLLYWSIAGGFAFLLASPYLSHASLSLGPLALKSIREWQVLPEHLPSGLTILIPVKLPGFMALRFGRAVVMLMAVGLAVAVWRRRALTVDVVVWATCALLLMNARVWWLPGSYALYPDRILLLTIIPAARMIGLLAETVSEFFPASAAWLRLAFVAAVLLLGERYVRNAYWAGLDAVSVTPDDVAAFQWIESHVPKADLIDNNYEDAGIWIPAVLNRSVRHAHVNFVYEDDVANWVARSEPRWVFVGARRVYDGETRYSLGALSDMPDRYRLAFKSGGAAVFEVQSTDASGP